MVQPLIRRQPFLAAIIVLMIFMLPPADAGGEVSAAAPLRAQASPFQFGREWHKYFARAPETNYEIAEMRNGNIIAVGSRVTGIEDVNAGPVITCFNRSGISLWRKVCSVFPEDIYVTVTGTDDGGFAAAGFTHKDKGILGEIEGIENLEDLDELKGMVETDGVVARFDENGAVLWRRTFGGLAFDEFVSLVSTGDSGFVAAGMRDAVTPLDKREMRPWLIRLDTLGNPLWETAYATGPEVTFSEVIRCDDGGFATAGKAARIRYSEVAEPALVDADFLLSKFDKNGKLIWSKTRNLNRDEGFFSLIQTADGDFMAAGYTTPKNGNASSSVISCFRSSGALRWSRFYGGSENSLIYSLIPGADSTIVALGNATSLDKELAGKRPVLEKGAAAGTRDKGDWDYNAYVIKLDGSGRKRWSTFFDNASSHNIISVRSGGYVFLGRSRGTAKEKAACTLSKIPEDLPSIGSLPARAFTGKAICPLPTVSFRGKTLRKDLDYTLSYKDNLRPGFGAVTIRGKGACTGTKTVYFRILPAKVGGLILKTGAKQLRISWKKAAPDPVSEYQLRYRAKGSGAWRYRTISSAKNSFLLNQLTKGRPYEIQIRGCRLDTALLLAGSWSAVKTSGKVR